MHISYSFTSMILIDMKFFNTAVGMMFILSTQHTLNNLISTTHPISNLSTQLSHPKSSGYVSAQYNKQKIREPEQFFQTVPTPGNPLFSALFRYLISPPVTSTRHTQHVSVSAGEHISPTTLPSDEHIFSVTVSFNRSALFCSIYDTFFPFWFAL